VAGQLAVVIKDFLSLTADDIPFPEGRRHEVDVVFMSPPWGGLGYNLLPEYSLRYLYPDFNLVLKKALEFSRDLVIFLPKNIQVEELIEYLIPHAAALSQGEKKH
jgi:23S rRNA G2445 N2-methylase RlmL